MIVLVWILTQEQMNAGYNMQVDQEKVQEKVREKVREKVKGKVQGKVQEKVQKKVQEKVKQAIIILITIRGFVIKVNLYLYYIIIV